MDKRHFHPQRTELKYDMMLKKKECKNALGRGGPLAIVGFEYFPQRGFLSPLVRLEWFIDLWRHGSRLKLMSDH